MINLLRHIETAVDRKVGHSLPRRVGAFGLLMGIVPTTVVAIITSLIIAGMLVDKVDSDLAASGGLIEGTVQFRLSQTARTLSDLADTAVVRNGLLDTEGRRGYLDPLLNDLISRNPELGLLALTDFEGNPLSLAQSDWIADTSRHQSVAQQAITKERIVWQMASGFDGPVLVVAWPVRYPPTQTYEGTLLAVIDVGVLITDAAAGISSYGLSVSDVDGNIRLRLGHQGLGSQVTRHYSVGLDDSSFPGLTVSLSTPAWRAYLPLAVFLFGFLCVGIAAVFLARFISQRLSERLLGALYELDTAVSKVGSSGRVSNAAIPVRGRDEIARLAIGFNRMMQAILSAQENLEQQVQERTRRLHEAQSRLSGVLESIRDIIYSVSLDYQRTLYMSPAAREFDEVRKHREAHQFAALRAMVHPEDADKVAEFSAEARDSGFAELRYRLMLTDGTIRWVQERAYMVFDESGQQSHIDGIITDVSASINAELAREAAERTLRIRERALASCGEGVLIAELCEDRIERLVYANDTFAKISGFSREDILGDDWRKLQVAPEDMPAMRELRKSIRNRQQSRNRLRLKRKDGSLVWVEISVAPVQGTGNGGISHMISVVNDISELVRGEQRYRQVVDSVREVIYQVDKEGRWTFINPAWTAITGYAVEDTLGACFLDFVHPDDQAFNIARFTELNQGKRDHVRHEVRYLTRSGSIRRMEVFSRPVTDEEGTLIGYSGTLADITEQYAAAETLRLRDRALQASSNGIVIVDRLQQDSPVIFVNQPFERITGYSSAESLGRNCKFLQGPDTNQPALEQIRRALQTETSCTVTLRNYRKSGEAFWNELTISPVRDPQSGAVTHYVGVQNDVTTQRESDMQMLNLVLRMDAVFTLSPDGFVVLDDDGRVDFVNPALERMCNLSAGELAGLDEEGFQQCMLGLSDPSQPYRAFDELGAITQSFTLKTDPPRILEVTRRTSGPDDQARVIYFRDITREAELNRMKSEFLSTAAHELRTPMASIMGFSELLLSRKYPEEKQRDLLDRINRQSKRLTALLNELLDLARIEARRGKDFDLRETSIASLIQEAVSALMMPGDPRTIELNMPECSGQVMVDHGKLQQALTNVLSNAYKYSPDGGRITLDLIHEQAGRVGIRVSDEGIGMTADHVRQAFDRFFRADTSGNIPGTGLGLAVVKEIVELHGGSVDLVSEYGKGTSITLWLPLLADSLTARPQAEPVSE